MDDAKATATAIATATLFCRSGASPNLPVRVSAESRTEACAAVAQLRAMKAGKAKPQETAVAQVTNKPWDGSPSRFTDAEWQRSCVLDRGGDAPPKQRCSLPIREPDGTLNRNAVQAAAGGRGISAV